MSLTVRPRLQLATTRAHRRARPTAAIRGVPSQDTSGVPPLVLAAVVLVGLLSAVGSALASAL